MALQENPENRTQSTQRTVETPLPGAARPAGYPPAEAAIRGETRERLPYQDDTMLQEQEEMMKKPNKVQEFLALFLGVVHGENIYEGVTIESTSDIERVKKIFSPIFRFEDSSIELKAGDTIVYDDKTGSISIYPREGEKGRAITPSGIIPVTRPSTPPWQDDEKLPLDQNTYLGPRLGEFVRRNGPQRTGANSCGRAVRLTLEAFGMKPTPQGNGNDWFRQMSSAKHKDKFQLIEVNSFADIPVGGILCYDGKGNLGSTMNRTYGHVEIKGSDNMFYSFYASTNAGGSAKSPANQRNNFEAWKADTGFQGVFVPKSKV